MRRVYKQIKIEPPKEVGERTLRFVASSDHKDRSRDIIEQDGWVMDNYEDNPVFLVFHDKQRLPAGRGVGHEYLEEDGVKKLAIDVEFINPADFDDPGPEVKFADTVYQMYKMGYLNTVSVGFIPIEAESMEDGGRHFIQQELYELSAVTVPDNPQAQVMRSLSEDDNALIEDYAQKTLEWSVSKLMQLSGKNLDSIREYVMNLKSKQLNEDTKQEVLGMLEDAHARITTLEEIVGEAGDEFDQDAKEELVGIVQAEVQAMNTMADLLGVTSDPDQDEDPEPEPESDEMDEDEDKDQKDKDHDTKEGHEDPQEDDMDEDPFTMEVGTEVMVEDQVGTIVASESDGPEVMVEFEDGETEEVPAHKVFPSPDPEPESNETDEDPVEDETDEDSEDKEDKEDEESEVKPYEGPDDPELEEVPGVMDLSDDLRALWVNVFNSTINEDETNEPEAIRAAWAAVNQQRSKDKYLEDQMFEIDFDDLKSSGSVVYEIDFE